MSFQSYKQAGFATELLPILPHDAAINPNSPSREDLEGSRGKVPGRRVTGGWYGFANWSHHVASEQELRDWAGWDAGIGLQGRKYPGLDIDVEQGSVADAIETSALLELGQAPARFGRGSRRLLVYAGDGLAKRRLAFRLPGRPEGPAGELLGRDTLPDDAPQRPDGDPLLLDAGDAADEPGTVHAVELLAQGQQYVVEGIHPKTGKPYWWRDGSPVEVGAEGLTPVTGEEIDAWFEALIWTVENVWDGEIIWTRCHGLLGSRNRSGGAVVQDLLRAPSIEAVAEALAAIDVCELSYDQWVTALRAIYAATGGSAEGLELAIDWSLGYPDNTPEVVESKWRSFEGDEHKVGWHWLAEKAKGGGFSAAAHEFPPYEPEEGQEGIPPGTPDSTDNMFQRFAWVEGAKRAVHLATGVLLDQEQFEFRIPPRRAVSPQGKPTKTSAWTVFKDAPKTQRKSFLNLTFRPGAPRVVEENLPDLQGPCLNIWREPARKHAIPDRVEDTDVQPWLGLAAFVAPIEAEREHMFDWMACTVQRQNTKLNQALVLGSRNEGIGKDSLLEPLRALIGRQYVKEIGPHHLTSAFNPWAVGAKLVIVQEMHNFERRETMNRLKPYVAAPPEALPINLKNRQEFYIPNLMSMVFFTNEDDALSLSKGDRRYFVIWNDCEPREAAYYEQLWAWLNAGGSEKGMRWLLQRDIARFDPKARAPMTEAKANMRKMARSALQEWVEDGIEQGDGVFARDLLVMEEIIERAPDYVRVKGQPVSAHKIAKVLRGIGAELVTEKVRLDPFDGSRRIWAVRKATMYRGLDVEVLRDLYLKHKAEADADAQRRLNTKEFK